MHNPTLNVDTYYTLAMVQCRQFGERRSFVSSQRCAQSQLPHLAGLANTIIGKEIRMKPNSGATKRSMNNQLDVELQLTDLGEEQQ